MFSETKVTENYDMADDFCEEFAEIRGKYRIVSVLTRDFAVLRVLHLISAAPLRRLASRSLLPALPF